MASDEFKGLLETLEILVDEKLVRRLVEAEDELEAGRGFELETVRAALGLGGD